MATSTQYNPNKTFNEQLFAAGASKTVYALVTPETETTKAIVLGDNQSETRNEYLEQFRDAWTAKQDEYHEQFSDVWHDWAAPVVDLDRNNFPFFYPTAGASEPLRHIIFDYAARARVEGFAPRIHIFEGEYEGYKAMAEAARIEVIEHPRKSFVHVMALGRDLPETEMFFLSQPSAIDGNVWHDFNDFLSMIKGPARVVIDLTYVGAISKCFKEKFNMNYECVRNVVFSLSKPFGVYYDRIGGVFCQEEDMGLFGNKWFKNLTSLKLGTALMRRHDVYYMAHKYGHLQAKCTSEISRELGIDLVPSDVFLLATAERFDKSPLNTYLTRAGRARLCLTPKMAECIGTSGKIS